MSNNSIVVKLGNKPKKLDFKLSKKKGEPKEIKIPENEITKEAEKYYFESKNLESFGDYKKPYWVFSDLESNEGEIKKPGQPRNGCPGSKKSYCGFGS